MNISTKIEGSIFELEEFIPFRLNQAAEKISLDFARIYKGAFGLTRPEWRTLANLGKHGQMTARQICDHSMQHKTKVSRAVASLEKRGWLERNINPDDRREEWLRLTREGYINFQKISILGTQCDMKIRNALGPENTAALEKVLDALEQYAGK